MSKRATDTDKLDRRHFNDPHRTVRAYGLLVLRPRGKGYGCSTAPTVILRCGRPG
uniref:Truncated crpP ciprofloxacin-modifying enzyme (CrpP) n=1 Tax=Pseudomonas aeruginosa TaxID=287 RepID=A0A8A2FVV5_PSEAI|nr:truncated crpP ciprofloxacin-modifying enzyme (CrpP) [Pseudomonas aeruginosa]